MAEKHKYYLRPAYDSDVLLIEFPHLPDEEKFISSLLEALRDIHPEIKSTEDLWMNDEVLFTIASSQGEFLLTIDIWRIAFIIAEKNQDFIKIIDTILNKSESFEKTEVDFNKYKIRH